MRTLTRVFFSVACVCGLLVSGAAVQAQTQLSPRISYISPVGAQAGSAFELRVSGQDLVDIEGLHFSFPGAKVETGGSEKTTLPTEGKKVAKGMAPPPTGLTTHKFTVTLPANAPLGVQDVRVITKAGISNPRALVVSDSKEFSEQEPNNDVPQAQKIELNSSVSGVVTTLTDVDFYSFTGKKGQRVVCSCLTTSVDSKLPASLQLYSADGSYLGFNRSYNQQDALLDATLPTDGEYYVRVSCFAYAQGGIDNFYRLTVTTAPWIDAVFPPVVEPGKASEVTVYGRNLPGGKLDPTAVVGERVLEKTVLTVKASNDPMAIQRLAYSGFVSPAATMLDGFDYRLKNAAGSSNPFLMTYATAPVVLDNADNDDAAKAQKVPTPCIIAGRIEKKGDRDYYAFTAKKGQVLSIEAFAERIGSPIDLYLQVRFEVGNLITELDDTVEVMSQQLFSRTDDPLRYRFTAPADGTYHVLVGTRESFTQWGPRHMYTVRITPEEPDFRLVAMPPSLISPDAGVVSQAGGHAFTVYIWRLGGFNSDIVLSGDNLPPGVSVVPQTISGSQKQAVVVVSAAAAAKFWAGPINIVGTATVDGKKLKREVRAATISWPVAAPNTPTITRLDRELVVAVREKAQYSLIVGKDKLSVMQGDKIAIPIQAVGTGTFKTPVQISALGAPTGLNLQALTVTPGDKGGLATFDFKGAASSIMPGNYTIFLRGQTQPPAAKPPAKAPPPNYVQVSMPVTLTIIPKQLAKVTASPLNAKVQMGKDIEVTVKAARQYDLPIAFKVEMILPAGVKGLTAKDVTIKANEDETKLTIAVSPQAMTGTASITIRATAMFNDTIPVVHETKLTLAISK